MFNKLNSYKFVKAMTIYMLDIIDNCWKSEKDLASNVL